MRRSALIAAAAAALLAAVQPVAAQAPLSPGLKDAIDAAARTGEVPNPRLASVVIAGIADDPGALEAIVAAARAAQPAAGDDVARRAARAYPGWAARIEAAAGLPPSAAPQTAKAPAPAPAPSRPSIFKNPYVDVAGGALYLIDSDLSDPALGSVDGTLAAKLGFAVTGAVGAELGKNFRVEAELGYRRNGLDKVMVGGYGLSASQSVSGTVSVLSGMLNGWYDVPGYDGFTPYLGGGAGLARLSVKIDDNNFDDSDLVFAYQFGAGVRVPITGNVLARIGYRFFATTQPKLGTTEGEYYSHAAEAGVTVRF